jgi:hypothetical protein
MCALADCGDARAVQREQISSLQENAPVSCLPAFLICFLASWLPA